MTHLSLRPDIWRAIRSASASGRRTFTLDEVRGQLRGVVRRERVLDYIKALTAGGYLITAATPDGTPGWQLLRDAGAEAPRLRPDGTPVTQGQGREALWRTLRILKVCSVAELAAHACTPERTVALAEAEDYADRLARAGILVREKGHGGTRYRLLPSRYTGPRPPQIRRTKEIFDPNTGTLYSAHGEVIHQGGRHD